MKVIELFLIIYIFMVFVNICKGNNCIYNMETPIIHDTIPYSKHESVKTITIDKSYQDAGLFRGVNINLESFQRKLKKLSFDYTGYKVEIESSRILLALEDKLFQQFENVSIEPIYKNNEHIAFAYTIGDFPKESSAMQLLQNIVKGRYPNARVVKYENGQRK